MNLSPTVHAIIRRTLGDPRIGQVSSERDWQVLVLEQALLDPELQAAGCGVFAEGRGHWPKRNQGSANARVDLVFFQLATRQVVAALELKVKVTSTKATETTHKDVVKAQSLRFDPLQGDAQPCPVVLAAALHTQPAPGDGIATVHDGRQAIRLSAAEPLIHPPVAEPSLPQWWAQHVSEYPTPAFRNPPQRHEGCLQWQGNEAHSLMCFGIDYQAAHPDHRLGFEVSTLYPGRGRMDLVTWNQDGQADLVFEPKSHTEPFANQLRSKQLTAQECDDFVEQFVQRAEELKQPGQRANATRLHPRPKLNNWWVTKMLECRKDLERTLSMLHSGLIQRGVVMLEDIGQALPSTLEKRLGRISSDESVASQLKQAGIMNQLQQAYAFRRELFTRCLWAGLKPHPQAQFHYLPLISLGIYGPRKPTVID